MTPIAGPCGRGEYRQEDATGKQVEVGRFYRPVSRADELYFIKRLGSGRDEIFAEVFRLGLPTPYEVFIRGRGQYRPPGPDKDFPMVESSDFLEANPTEFIQEWKEGIKRLEKWVEQKKPEEDKAPGSERTA